MFSSGRPVIGGRVVAMAVAGVASCSVLCCGKVPGIGLVRQLHHGGCSGLRPKMQLGTVNQITKCMSQQGKGQVVLG